MRRVVVIAGLAATLASIADAEANVAPLRSRGQGVIVRSTRRDKALAGAHLVLSGTVLAHLTVAGQSGWEVPLALALTYLGYEAADFISGVVHITTDTIFASPDFRRHHLRPREVTRRSFANAAAGTAPVALAFLGATLIGSHFAPMELKLAIDAVGLGLGQGAFLANVAHKHSHMTDEENPWIVRTAQRLGLMATREEHVGRHHRPPYDRSFAVLTGHSNRLIDRLKLLQKIRRGYWKLTGKVPFTWREPGGEKVMKEDLPEGPYPTITPITPEEAGLGPP